MNDVSMEGVVSSTAYWIVLAIVTVLLVIAWWRIFVKAGEEGWKSIIPFYNTYTMFKIAWGNGWLFLLCLIPCVNAIVMIILEWKTCKAYGKGVGFFIGMLFLPNIFYLILGFDSSVYIGPNGEAR